jgi:DNA-directed RNA polymerase subunit RPC12/RpoP
MIIIHTFIYCLNCKMKLEVYDDENTKEFHEIYCPECGYTNELDDIRIDMFEEEY